MKSCWFSRVCFIVLFSVGLAFTIPPGGDSDQDHRDAFQMNSISGGDFRSYISDNIHESDRWAHAMRTFGTFHNHMHEMMSSLARYGVEQLGDGDRVPHFDDRIAGGEWGNYRQNLEEDGVESAWMDFVQITEIMHDRVHHAMYKSTVFDKESRDRDVDLEAYIPEERAPFTTEETIPASGDVRMEFVSMENFRTLAWHYDFENPHLHDAMQAMIAFDELLYHLMTEWALYGAEKEAEACRAPSFDVRVSGEQWSEYASRVDECEDEPWRNFVKVVGLMHDRIHHMMYQMVLHDAATHDREAELRHLIE